jgi:hypothetical protein
MSKIESLRRLLETESDKTEGHIIGRQLEDIANELLLTRTGVSMHGVRGAPDWRGFETDLWELSEELRNFYKANRTLRGKNPLSDSLARIASNPQFGKGRQMILLILGQYGGGDYGEVFGNALKDRTVYGHAIDALIKAKVKGHHDQVASILELEKTGWIRRAAKKYLERFGPETE